jgi:hypothetical protein
MESQMSATDPAETLIQSALKVWKLNEVRFARTFHPLTEAELQKEVAPERNRLLYIWGHIVAVNDALFPLLGIGPKLYPEMDEIFIRKPDRSSPDIYSGEQVKEASTRINAMLWDTFTGWKVTDWLAPHTEVKPEEFAADPSRNRFSVMVNRTAHVAYHLGQAVLVTKHRE